MEAIMPMTRFATSVQPGAIARSSYVRQEYTELYAHDRETQYQSATT